MKTYFIKSIILGVILFFSSPAKSEVNFHLNFGLPAWGPAGYEHERYYYLPDVEAYYDTRWGHFVYLDNGKWLHRRQLPAIYANYNLFNGYKVVMNGHRGYMPYMNFKTYKVKYAKGYNPGRQKAIGNNRGKGKSNYNKPKNSFKNQKGNSGYPSIKNKKQDYSSGNSNGKYNEGNSAGSSHQDKQKNAKGGSQGHSKSGGGKGNGGKKGKK